MHEELGVGILHLELRRLEWHVVGRLAGKVRIHLLLLIHIRYLLPRGATTLVILTIHRLMIGVSVVVEVSLLFCVVVVGGELLVFHSLVVVGLMIIHLLLG